MKVLTFDLETGTAVLNKRKASPFHPENYVVAAGFQIDAGEPFCHYFADKTGYQYFPMPLEGINVLVGFNIKFDLLYSWTKEELTQFFKRGGIVWDCQYVHYLLNGMQPEAHMASMDSIIESYGGELKIDEVKALWEQGYDTKDIPEDLLIRYLKGDVSNTYKIFSQQRLQCTGLHPNFKRMVYNRMLGLLATTEMEWNGLQIDKEVAESDRDDLATTYKSLLGELNRRLPELPEELEYNWNSIYHRSYLLFGGTARYQRWVQHTVDGEPQYAKKTIRVPVLDEEGEQVRYKSGKKAGELKFKNQTVPDMDKPKGKLTDFYFDFKPITKPKDSWASDLRDPMGKPIYSTSSDVIEELGTLNIPFLKDLAKSQKVHKDLSTYYWMEDNSGKRRGLLTLVGQDGKVHHKLNHTSTVTGRLSSSDPNLQNIPRGDKSLAKRMFVSRFGSNGRICEIDYSQLEVIVQGVLTEDERLIRDIQDGIDFHCKRLALLLNEPYAEVKRRHLSDDPDTCAARTRIKEFTFQRAYGAGAQSIAASTGLDLDTVRALIDRERDEYPGIEAFDEAVSTAQIHTNLPAERLVIDGAVYLAEKGQWFSPTGTRYVWTEREAPDYMQEKGIMTSFSPTERKNWPVQGLGGEIVQTMIGYLWRTFLQRDNFENRAFLVNTVHDCVLIDSHVDVVHKVVPMACKVLESVPHRFNADFGMNINVEFPVEAETGPNWYEMEHYGR